TQWWEPVGIPPYYWPPGVPLVRSLASYIRVFEQLGYERCDDGKYARGYEKIAIYVDRHGVPSHAARHQGPNKWTTKLGRREDIEHVTLEALTGNVYGTVAQFLRRRSRRSHAIGHIVEASVRLIQRLKHWFRK